MLNARLKVGFEFEFCYPIDSSVKVRDAMTNILGLDPTNKWTQLKGDCSIYPGHNMYGYEMVTPPQDVEVALETLQKFSTWLDKSGGTTNDSTGLHFGLSAEDIDLKASANLFKLMLLADERAMSADFGRGDSRWCRPGVYDLRRNAGNNLDIRSASEAFNNDRIFTIAQDYNRFCCNVLAIRKNNYIEYRGMGGKDYHKKFDTIRKWVDHQCKAMLMALDPNDNELFEEKFKAWYTGK